MTPFRGCSGKWRSYFERSSIKNMEWISEHTGMGDPPQLSMKFGLTFSILGALQHLTWLCEGFSPVALEGPSLSSFEQNLRVWLNRTRSLPSRGEFYIQLSTIYPFQWCKLEASEICHPLKSHAISFKQVWMVTIYLLPRLYTNSFLFLVCYNYLEPKWPLFWLEKALFCGVDLQKQRSVGF